ncbi:MAG: nicotinate phosphoribosyltransferase, partial [Acidipropionibacterium jensenii]|nr:nicotinate phosphoribosyltransferase [Acidipropionibacterium jensenii]
MSTALLTDHYELTMVEAAMRAGTAFRPCVFELFPRRLPEGRRYGVVAGVGRMLDAVADFHFEPEEIDFLVGHQVVSEQMAQW